MSHSKFLSAIMNDDVDDFDMIEFVKLKREEREGRKREMEEVMLQQKNKKYKPRRTYLKKNPKMSNWWTDYVLDERGTFSNPDHPNARLFTYRFSFAFEAVKELIAKVKESGEHFWKQKRDAAGRESSPIELLVLGSLRILTRNVTLDDLHEQTFISAEVHRCFFTKFMKWYSSRVFPEVVKMPSVEDLDCNGAEYSLAGFPGCVCSVDCVHVRVWGVSANLKQISTGKEHFPSRVFEVAVNRRGMIVSATKGFYGSVVDMTIVKFDSAMVSMRNGVYSEYEYLLYDADGYPNVVKGGYCICDNGYLKWPTMMAPSKGRADDPDWDWSEMLESLRKDIECLFGQMKQEFAILKYGSRFNSLELMDDIFLTCCAIHNQRKIISGADLPWSCTEITIDDDESDLSQSQAAIWRRLREQRRLNTLLADNGSGGLGAGEHSLLNEDSSAETVLSYNAIKQRLITHFNVANNKGEVFWPTRRGIIRNYIVASDR
jgi:Plant transposon protein